MDKVLEVYKEQFYYELNRRNQVYSNLSFTIGLFTLTCTMFSYLAKQTIEVLEYSISEIYITFLCLSGFFILCAFLSLALLLLRRRVFQFEPKGQRLHDYEIGMINAGNKRRHVEKLFIEGMKKAYAEASTINRKINQNKEASMKIINQYMLFSVFPLFIAFVLYAFCYTNNHRHEENNGKATIDSKVVMELNITNRRCPNLSNIQVKIVELSQVSLKFDELRFEKLFGNLIT